MSRSSKKNRASQKRTPRQPKFEDPSPDELAAIEHDWLVDMVGEEDAAYFEAAGIDDIGNK